MAAAIGAGLPIHEPVGNMVVDVGGGTAEMAVISLGGVVAVEALRCGGFDFDASIQNYVRATYGIAIGERTAEAVKMAIGSGHPYEHEQQAEIRGREVATGRPKTVVLSPLEVRGALEDNVASVIEAAANCLSEAPPELAQDIMFQGVHLTGGGALLRGMTQRLADATAVPVHLVDTPLECVVQGAGHLPGVLRQAAPALHRGRLSRSAPSGVVGPAPPTWARRATRRPPGAPASRGRRRRGATRARLPDRRSRPGRRWPAGAPSACPRAHRARPAGPAGSPMAPSAATAASRQRVSSWARATSARADAAGR